MRFSERYGHKAPAPLQFESIDEKLKNGLWSTLSLSVLKFKYEGDQWERRYYTVSKIYYLNFLKLPIDETPDDADHFLNEIKDWIYDAEWFEIYDLIEFTYNVEFKADGSAMFSDSKTRRDNLSNYCNVIMRQENSAYRLVNGLVAPITNQTEINEITQSMKSTEGFLGVSTHIERSISLLSDRKNPDYRNSIKEAISAVESAARVISGNEKATLGDAIKIIEKKRSLHKSLKDGILKLYGYTSDEGGNKTFAFRGEHIRFC